MIIIKLIGRELVLHQLTDYLGKSKITIIKWGRISTKGLHKYIKTFFSNQNNQLNATQKIIKTMQSLNKYLENTEINKETSEILINENKSSKPYKLTSEVKNVILESQGENLAASLRQITKNVEEATGMKISYESVRKVVKNSAIGRAKKIFKNLVKKGKNRQKINKSSNNSKQTMEKPMNKEKIQEKEKITQRLTFLNDVVTGIPSRYLSILVLVAFLPKIGFYDFLETLSTNRKKGFSDLELFFTLFYLPLIGCTRLEHLDTLPVKDYKAIIVKNKIPGADCLRSYLSELASRPELKNAIKNLYQGWIHEDLIDGRIIYIDGRVLEYFGEKNLEKTKHGVKNRLVKGIIEDRVYDTITDRPIISHFDPANTSLSQAVLKLIESTEEATDRHVEIIIFDRGGNSFKVFKELLNRSTHFIVWSKSKYTAINNLKKTNDGEYINLAEIAETSINRRKQLDRMDDNNQSSVRKLINKVITDREIQNYISLTNKKLTQQNQRKENNKLFTALWDTEATIKEVGLIRVIMAMRSDGTKIGILTSLTVNEATPLEILLLLKRRQREENFFRDQKNGLASSNIGGWSTSIVELNEEKELFLEELKNKEAKLAKAIKKYKNKEDTLSTLSTRNIMDKYDLNLLKKRNSNLLEKNQRKFDTIASQIQELETQSSEGTAISLKTVERLNPERAQILTCLRDILYVSCQLLCQDIADIISQVIEPDYQKDSNSIAQKYANFTPKRLYNEFLRQGGVLQLSHSEDTLNVVFNQPKSDYWKIILPELCNSLNTKDAQLNLGRGVIFKLHYSVN